MKMLATLKGRGLGISDSLSYERPTRQVMSLLSLPMGSLPWAASSINRAHTSELETTASLKLIVQIKTQLLIALLNISNTHFNYWERLKV